MDAGNMKVNHHIRVRRAPMTATIVSSAKPQRNIDFLIPGDFRLREELSKV
jgi:hypothetical protein